MDRGYIDFERLSTIDKYEAFFVIRAKANLNLQECHLKKQINQKV